MKYVIGARASRLSLAQVNLVVQELGASGDTAEFEIKKISTKGDVDPRAIFAIDQRGIFEKEIDAEVKDKRIDFAVHSMKDVPTQLPDDLTIACVPRRAAVNDILVTKNGETLESLAKGARVGTSSLRRAVQASRARADLDVMPLRGNIDTRISRVQRGEIDAAILARAGIERLKTDAKFCDLSAEQFMPSPGQGALALVARSDNAELLRVLQRIEHKDSRAEIDAERAFSGAVDSGCRFPVGAYAQCTDGTIHMRAVAFSVDGSERIDADASGSDARAVGERVGQIMREHGVQRLALNWRENVERWNAK